MEGEIGKWGWILCGLNIEGRFVKIKMMSRGEEKNVLILGVWLDGGKRRWCG